MAQHKEEAAQEAATAGAAPDNTPANAPAALGPATAAAAKPTTPRPSGGYMGCGGTQAQYQVPGDPLPTCTPIPRLCLRRRRLRRHHRRPCGPPPLPPPPPPPLPLMTAEEGLEARLCGQEQELESEESEDEGQPWP